jgi:hypothetical protein
VATCQQVAQSLPLATSDKNRRPDVKYRHSAQIASKRKGTSFLKKKKKKKIKENIPPVRRTERNLFLSAKVLTDLKVVTNGHHRHIRLLTATKQQSATISNNWRSSIGFKVKFIRLNESIENFYKMLLDNIMTIFLANLPDMSSTNDNSNEESVT